jgi:signal transduction histidine kinase
VITASVSAVFRPWNRLCNFDQIPEAVEWNNVGTLKLREKPMWTVSKRLRRPTLTYAQLESVVLERTAELQTLSQRLLKVQDEEKRKLSRDLHDSTGQTLTALKIGISLLQEQCKENPSTTLLASEAALLADQAIAEIRTTSYLLHPPLLDEVGFACAAEWYVEGFAKRTRVNVKLDVATTEERLPIWIEIALFRVLQESLTNVHRHSRALEVSVCLLHYQEKIVLEIRDDGCGIPAERLNRLREASAETGVGLAGMRERMKELNGKLDIESNGYGTTVRAIVPHPATHVSDIRDHGKMVPPSISRGRLRQPDVCPTALPEPAAISFRKRTWNLGVGVFVALILLASWFAFRHTPSISPSLELQSTNALDQQLLLQRLKAIPVEDKTGFPAPPIPLQGTRTERFRLAGQKVVHFGKDVTVRYFTPKLESPSSAVEKYHVVHIGEDVTVRYFTTVSRTSGN